MDSTRAADAERGLVRAIGVRGLTASIVNTTVGAGIFVLPATVAGELGTAAPLAYLACAFIMTLVVASFAAAGSRVSLTGGIYAYVEVAFGPLIGFVTGFLVWASSLLAAASVASALAASLAQLLPVVGTVPGKAAALAVVYVVLATTNVRGVALGTRIVEGITLAKLLPLILLLIAGMFWVRPPDLVPTLASPEQVGAASILLIFAFVGVEIALVPTGEIHAPARTLPRALFSALAITTVLYLAIQLVAQAVLRDDLARYADAPLAAAASRVLGGWGGTLMLVGGSVSMLGFLCGDALGTPRSLFAFGRDGFLPATFARLHPRFGTPWLAIVTHAGIVWAAASIGTFGVLILLSNVALLSAYVLCCASAVQLARRNVRTADAPFTVPGGAAVPIAACVVLVWLLSSATRQEFAVTAGAALVAVVLYAVRGLRRRRALGEVEMNRV